MHTHNRRRYSFKPHNINYGTFNVRGIIEEEDRQTLVKYANKYQLDILAVTEMHIKDECNNFEIGEYILFTVNKEKSTNSHGTGILVKKHLKTKFE